MNSRYEIGFIITPDANEEEVKKIVESISSTIKKAQGVIESVDEWGRKKMAYPIKKNLEGYYVFIQTEVDGAVIADLERRLKQIEKVLRFITLRLDDKLKKANKLTKRWKKIENFRRKTQDSHEEGKEGNDSVGKEEETNADEK
jgi:small subunit ribosomal protein S6